MKLKKVVGILLLVCASPVFAGFVGDAAVGRIHTKSNGYVYFGVVSPPSDTCRWYGEDFRFDVTTPAGKAMLSNLLAGKAASKQISVWYQPSSAPGTTESNGCDESSIAIVTGVSQQ